LNMNIRDKYNGDQEVDIIEKISINTENLEDRANRGS
jgi:hypothetical protein